MGAFLPQHIEKGTHFWYHYYLVLEKHKFTCIHSAGDADGGLFLSATVLLWCVHAVIKNILLSIVSSPLGPVAFQTSEHSWAGVCFLEYCVKKAAISNWNALSDLLRTQNCTCVLHVQFAICCISSSVQESPNSNNHYESQTTCFPVFLIPTTPRG